MSQSTRGSNAPEQRRDGGSGIGSNSSDRHVSPLTSHEDSSEPRCLICSFNQPYPSDPIPIYHRHFSSTNLRELLGVEESGAGYFCPSCKSRHRPYIDERLKVVVSDTTLHEVFAISDTRHGYYEGDLLHADYLTIANGTLPELLHAFKQEYIVKPRPKPLDVVLVAGYSDILKDYSREFIHWGLSEFARSVLGEGATKTPHSFTIASMMYPPSHCWFEDDGPTPYRYVNKIDKFDWLNKKIHEINLHNNAPAYPCFHSYGTRKTVEKVVKDDGTTTDHHIRVHRWEHWAEYARREKFTLRIDRKFKLAKAVNNYFVFRT